MNFICNYELLPELFAYKDQKIAKNQSKRKRKHSTETVKLLDSSDKEISDLRNITTKALPVIQSQIDTNSGEGHLQFLQDETVFPKMQGYNNTTVSKTMEIQGNEYLIPATTRLFNRDVKQLEEVLDVGEKFDLIVMDPPWWNKYIRRVKKAKASLGYAMLPNESLLDIPIQKFVSTKTLLVIWCTNSPKHQAAILEKFLPVWNMKPLAKWYWMKINTSARPVCDFHVVGQKQPFEVIFIAAHKDSSESWHKEIGRRKVIFSIPSVIHSHKPPLFEFFREFLSQNPKCLELFARYLHPHFTSIGLEVLKLMDLRLYKTKS